VSVSSRSTSSGIRSIASSESCYRTADGNRVLSSRATTVPLFSETAKDEDAMSRFLSIREEGGMDDLNMLYNEENGSPVFGTSWLDQEHQPDLLVPNDPGRWLTDSTGPNAQNNNPVVNPEEHATRPHQTTLCDTPSSELQQPQNDHLYDADGTVGLTWLDDDFILND
jgi:hypothetical protein